MIATKAVLKIPGDRCFAKISTTDDATNYFVGDEEQARRISHCLPPLIGGDTYAYTQGDLFERGELMCFKIEDGAGLGNDVEIEFKDNFVYRASVVWS